MFQNAEFAVFALARRDAVRLHAPGEIRETVQQPLSFGCQPVCFVVPQTLAFQKAVHETTEQIAAVFRQFAFLPPNHEEHGEHERVGGQAQQAARVGYMPAPETVFFAAGLRVGPLFLARTGNGPESFFAGTGIQPCFEDAAQALVSGELPEHGVGGFQGLPAVGHPLPQRRANTLRRQRLQRQCVEPQIQIACIVFPAARSDDGCLAIEPFEFAAKVFHAGCFGGTPGARDLVEAVQQKGEPVRFAQSFGSPTDVGGLFREELSERLVADPVAETSEKGERRPRIGQSAAGEVEGEFAEGCAFPGAGGAQKSRPLTSVKAVRMSLYS